MKCQNCGIKDANVRYSQNINGDRLELRLCSECARKMNIGVNFDFNFGFGDLFSSFFDEFEGKKRLLKGIDVQCDSCGRSYSEFVNNNMSGCPNCYIVFDNSKKQLNKYENERKIAEKIQERHKEGRGIRTIRRNKSKEELEELDIELKECIKNEDYEKAAIIRDKIKKIKDRMEIDR